MAAANIVRLAMVTGLLGLTVGCSLQAILGMSLPGGPDGEARLKARFKATVQAELRNPVPLDWGSADQNIRLHFMGPTGVALCGRPTNALARQRAYQINYYSDWFGGIEEFKVETPAHPSTGYPYPFCEMRPDESPSLR